MTHLGAVPDSLLRPRAARAFTVVDAAAPRISPPEWRDVRLHPSFNDDVTARPRIVASIDIETLFAQWGIPGVVFLEYPYVDAAT